MRWFYCTLFCAMSFWCFSQKGDFLLTQHLHRHPNIGNSNFEIANDRYGRICIANKAGILKYDGEVWDFYKTPAAALSLAVDSAGIVYAGCIGSVGFVDFQGREIRYQPLLEQDTLKELFLETYFTENTVVFLGEKTLVKYNLVNKEVKTFEGEFLNVYSLQGHVFVNTTDGRTYALQDTLISISPKFPIAYTSPKHNYPTLALDFDNNVYIQKNGEFESLAHNKVIEKLAVEMQQINWINDSLFVCSTFEDGLLFFNINKPNQYKTTDYRSGLPDNNIYAMHADNSNSVWVAHQFGITQISPLFPAYSYSNYQGLEGTLTGVSYHKKDLWVTTSHGLFYFTKDTLFENKVYYVRLSASKEEVVERDKKETKKKRGKNKKPFLKRLFKKKKRAKTDDNKEKDEKKGLFASITKLFEGEKVDRIKGKKRAGSRYIRKTQKIPVSYNYAFKKIQGANGKFIDVIPFQNKLLGVSTSGIYEIRGNEASLIIPESVQSYYVNSKNQLILSTTDLKIKAYILSGDVWIEIFEDSMHDIIVSMQEDQNGTLWLAGTTSIYQTYTSDSTFILKEELPLNNIYLDEVNIMHRKDKLYFINSEGYYYYDKPSNTVKEDTLLKQQLGIAIQHIYDPKGKGVWIFDGKIWNYLKQDGGIETLDYLSLFPNLQAIATDPKTNMLWLITQTNELLKYDPSKESGVHQFGFFLKKVSNEYGTIDQSSKFTLGYEENFINIELSKPDFLGFSNPEFQYKLQGLHTTWSDWTKSKSIDFSFLPEGDYSLLVRSRDAFGRVEEGKVLSFSVKPPYWQTTWFYAIQVLFFGALVYYSTKLNQDNSKNRLVRSGLTLLTLVLIIEFLQSAIGSLFSFKSTPVVDFLLDAVIAFMISPLERLLRELMTKGRVCVSINADPSSLGRKGN